MPGLEIPLHKAHRRVREGEARLADQAAIVAHLQNGPFPEIAAIAEDLLRQYNKLLQQAQDQVVWLEQAASAHVSYQ